MMMTMMTTVPLPPNDNVMGNEAIPNRVTSLALHPHHIHCNFCSLSYIFFFLFFEISILLFSFIQMVVIVVLRLNIPAIMIIERRIKNEDDRISFYR